MTPDQAADREERMAIMIHDGGCHPNFAEKYCNSKPEIYGVREENLKQEGLFNR